VRGHLEGNNFEGQSHEPFAHLAILTVGGGNCQGNSRTTGTIGKTGKRQYCFYQLAPRLWWQRRRHFTSLTAPYSEDIWNFYLGKNRHTLVNKMNKWNKIHFSHVFQGFSAIGAL
jgi:hypothetical protein